MTEKPVVDILSLAGIISIDRSRIDDVYVKGHKKTTLFQSVRLKWRTGESNADEPDLLSRVRMSASRPAP